MQSGHDRDSASVGNWEIATLRPVHPARNLRPNSKNFQHLVGPEGQEYLVIRGKRPYGTLTKTALSDEAHESHLLHIVGRDDTGTVFEVPDELLSLPAATYGSRGRPEVLLPVYQDLKTAIARVAQLGMIEHFGIDDFAVTRTTGDILLLPPMRVRKGTSMAQELLGKLAADIRRRYQPSLGSRGTAAIVNILEGEQ